MTEPYPAMFSDRFYSVMSGQDPHTLGRRWYDGRAGRLRDVKEDYVLSAAKHYEKDGLSSPYGVGRVCDNEDVVAYFDVRMGGLAVPLAVSEAKALSDESFLEMAKMQWDIVGYGFRALRMDIVKDKPTMKPVRVDIYWLKGWEEDE